MPYPGGPLVDIAVIGTGYVGLVTGAGLADFGNDVVCVDVDVAKIDALKQGKIPIYEPGLDTIVSRNVAEGERHPGWLPGTVPATFIACCCTAAYPWRSSRFKWASALNSRRKP